MKRELSKEEKRLNNKSISRFEEEIEYQQYLYEHAKLMLELGLTQNYKRQVIEYTAKKKEALGISKELSERIKILKKQNKEGVEKK